LPSKTSRPTFVHDVLRMLARAGVFAIVGSSGGCSMVLDWNGYTGGLESHVDAASDAEAPSNDAATEAAPCSTTCLGCCNEQGQCAPGTTTAVCGSAGAACANCSSDGRVCSMGACVSAPPIDSGATCTDDECQAMHYTCGQITVFYMPQPCCQSSGICGCTPDPTGATGLGCGPKL
jgi:hypothetical protein